jgi:hypothetical protein
MHGNGEHHASLGAVIETMRQTENDLSAPYEETSLGGLVVNVLLADERGNKQVLSTVSVDGRTEIARKNMQEKK